MTYPKEPIDVDRRLGALLKARRIELGLTQNELAMRLGITFQQVQKYESGTNRVSAGRLWNIAELLDVDISYFFQIENSKKITKSLIIQSFIEDEHAITLVKHFQSIENEELRKVVSILALKLSGK